ncbi:hypothetical protein M9458_027965, partial [Cirrhinus mrigala]
VPSLIDTAGLRPGPDRPFQSFIGCIHDVRLNGELQDLGSGLAGVEGILPGCHSCSTERRGRRDLRVSHRPQWPTVPCQNSRCVHGVCVPKGSSYSCSCADGYSGHLPSARGCTAGEPFCHCQTGYSGPACET